MGRPYTEVGGDDVLVGSVVGDRYHVAGILGQGSTGTVFGVEHIHFGRRAAMKVLRPRSTPADVVHRVFNGDARAAWSVNHPCIVDVFDVGTLPDGAPFFVTEYLEGETLAKRIARDRLSLAAAVDVMMQILSAVAAVHERALLVRDLRPQNVFLAHRRGCRPVAKILDLGLGRLMPLEAVAEQWEADPAGAAQSVPHPHYLSPERTRSEHGIDPSSDLFVAGVIFYEMLTGTRPFSAPSYHGLLLQIAQANPTPVSDLRDHSLGELDAFVARSLSGNPRGRFASAKEMQDELRRIFESAKRGSSTASASIHTHAAPPSGSAPNVAHGMPSMAASKMGAVSSVKPIASSLEPDTPREDTLAQDAPTATSTERPPDLDGADLYSDETETDRRFFDLAPYRDPNSSARLPVASRATSSRPRFDDPPADKTLPPQGTHPTQQPPTMQAFEPMQLEAIEDEEDEKTEARSALHDADLRSIRDANKTPLPPIPEEETQQMQMTPEIRAKIEAQYAAQRAKQAPRPPMQSEGDSIPPPTKRLDK